MLVSKNALLLFLLIIVVNSKTIGQEMNGYVHSNYSGITGAQINPTAIVNSKLYFDFNIIGLHINADNDFVYLSKDEYKFNRFLSTSAEFPKHGEDNRIFYDHFTEDPKNAFTQVKILGPSFMYTKNDKAIGVSTSIRNIVSGDQLPYEITKFGIEGFDYYPLQRINFIDNKDAQAGALSFAEISATYAQVIHKSNRDHFTAGITLKGLLGFGGSYLYLDNADYIVPNNDTLIVNNINGKAGVSLPIDYTNNDVLFPDKIVLGTGLGFDIGVTYQLKMKGHTNKRYSACEQPFEDYYYKIGLSLIDIGYIKFKKNTQQIDLVNRNAYWIDFANQDLETVDVLFKAVSQQFSGDSNQLVNNSAFSIYLPSAISLQYDMRIQQSVYINATIIHPLVLNEYTIVRPPQISITPRIEKDKFELAVPFSLYKYRYPRVGLSVRFSKFIIGTDKLGGFFGMNDFSGLDLYFMVKLPLIKGQCRGIKKGFNCGNMEYRQYLRSTKRLRSL